MDNSPKLYMLKNAEGKYYNSRLNSWEKKLFLGTFTTNNAKAQEVINFFKLDAKVIVVTFLPSSNLFNSGVFVSRPTKIT